MLTNELPFKVLSLLFAVLLWSWVQTQQIVAQRTRAQVKWTFPNELTWVEPVPKTLVVTVRGPQGLVRNVKKRTLRYDVDLSEAEVGPINVDFSSRSLKGVPEGVSVVQISPPGVDIDLDRKMERVVRIKPAVIGEVAIGYRLARNRGGAKNDQHCWTTFSDPQHCRSGNRCDRCDQSKRNKDL